MRLPKSVGVVGEHSGSQPDFRERYSKLIKQMRILWDEDTLDLYLRSPGRLVPGNRMPITGIRDHETRREIVDWLKRNKGVQ